MNKRAFDEIDMEIISILQKNGRSSVKEIAERVNLSSPAVSQRIGKMEREKIILGYQVQIAQQLWVL